MKKETKPTEKIPHYRHDIGGECSCSSPHIENEKGEIPVDGLKSR